MVWLVYWSKQLKIVPSFLFIQSECGLKSRTFRSVRCVYFSRSLSPAIGSFLHNSSAFSSCQLANSISVPLPDLFLTRPRIWFSNQSRADGCCYLFFCCSILNNKIIQFNGILFISTSANFKNILKNLIKPLLVSSNHHCDHFNCFT